ncbi:heme ABC transporter ATP-binding protein [Alcaligenes sp. WGS1538]|uniref:heme ABC transporter ATP-binding protein n=1 Tax=Alcaligenes sp. WGS1538 TaxID=3366811 RepID=UPI00372D7AAF
MNTDGVQELESRKLRVERGGDLVLDGVSLRVRPGELLGVLGANGAGKSTLLGALAGEAGACCSSQVWLKSRPLSQWSLEEQARQRAVLPQESGLGFSLAVSQVIAMGAYAFPTQAPANVTQCVRDAAQWADVAHLLERDYTRLSGGERQRVHFARALVQVLLARDHRQGARYLLLDEPTASLDPRHQQRLLQTVGELARMHGLGVLLILHDVNLAARWCDRLALLHRRQVLAQGTPEAVLTVDNLRELYGLEATILPHPLRRGRPLVVFS